LFKTPANKSTHQQINKEQKTENKEQINKEQINKKQKTKNNILGMHHKKKTKKMYRITK
jgi:hypothetical protein